MKAKRILATLILAALALGTTACSNTQSTSGSSSQSSVSSQSITSEVTKVDNNFDFEKVRKNIVINGKKYEFPFAVKDLGEGFSLKEDEIVPFKSSADNGYYSVAAELYYGDIEVASLTYCGITEEEVKNNSIDYYSKDIEHFFQSSNFHDIGDMYIEVDGFKVGDEAKVIEKYGTPNVQKGSPEDPANHYYGVYTESKKEIVSFMSEDGIITRVEIGALRYGSI